jgi:O-antigen ligase
MARLRRASRPESVARSTLTAVRRVRFDAVSVLTVYVVLLYVVPSDRTIAALGGAGSPAALFGVVAGVVWVLYQVSRTESTVDAGRRPLRVALFLFLAAALVSYILAMLSPHPAVEISAADQGLIRLVSFAGVVLIASDGIRDTDRFHLLLRRIAFAGALLALLGLVQFLTKQSFVDSIAIPGFAASQDFSSVQDRSGFARAAATATNPLEYAYVLSMILPIALTLALEDTARSRLRRWLPASLIIAALALSGSRSGIVGLFVTVVLLFPTWTRSIRLRAFFVTVIGAAAIYLFVPGMIGTLRGLFSSFGQDPSAASRTDSYQVAGTFIVRNPIFGRGFGTFLPQYRILDNQILLTIIEIGAVGMCALLGVIVTGIVIVLTARRRYPDRLFQKLGPALATSVIAGTLIMAFFDVFSFRMSVGTFFLIVGVCGAYWRIAPTAGHGAAAPPPGAAVSATGAGRRPAAE